MNIVFYLSSVIVLTILLIYVRRIALELALPVTPSLCIISGFLLYSASLVPGVFGILTPLGVTLTLSIISVFLYAFLKIMQAQTSSVRDRRQQPSMDSRAQWEGRFVFFAIIGIVGAKSLAEYVVHLPTILFSRSFPLSWDAVSYHVPVLVDFVQQKSLWSMNLPFQSYSFGYELIAGFPSYFFPQHWGFMIANSYAIIFLLASAFLIIRTIMARLIDAPPMPLVMSSFFLSVGIWSALFSSSIFAVGNNDIFVCACLLMTFGLLLEYLAEESVRCGKVRKRILLMFLTMSLGLAIASKPTALAYLPFFGLVLSVSEVRMQSSIKKTMSSFLSGFRAATGLVMGSILIGGFWYLKNVINFGKIYDPRLSDSFGNSLISNLLNPGLYDPREKYIFIFFWSCITIFISLALLREVKRRGNPLYPLILLFLFHLNSLAAFSVTPWAIFHTPRKWDLRLGMPLFTLSAITTSLGFIYYSRRATYSRSVRFLPVAIVSVLLIIAVILPAWWNKGKVHGLPGYEKVKNLPATDAYTWIQELNKPVRIYSAGLRPYGLYGRNWQNKVFFDLHSTHLRDDPASRERILMVMKVFRPDMLAISVDPHKGGGTDKPSIVNWLRNQNYLREAYNDETVSIFEVDSGWKNHLPDFQISSFPVVMGR